MNSKIMLIIGVVAILLVIIIFSIIIGLGGSESGPCGGEANCAVIIAKCASLLINSCEGTQNANNYVGDCYWDSEKEKCWAKNFRQTN